jgi:hypothetical protein
MGHLDNLGLPPGGEGISSMTWAVRPERSIGTRTSFSKPRYLGLLARRIYEFETEARLLAERSYFMLTRASAACSP